MDHARRIEEILRLKDELGIDGAVLVAPSVDEMTEDEEWRLMGLMHFFNDLSGVDAKALERHLRTVKIGLERFFLLDTALLQSPSWDDEYDNL